jgi:hypothetical protein
MLIAKNSRNFLEAPLEPDSTKTPVQGQLPQGFLTEN